MQQGTGRSGDDKIWCMPIFTTDTPRVLVLGAFLPVRAELTAVVGAVAGCGRGTNMTPPPPEEPEAWPAEARAGVRHDHPSQPFQLVQQSKQWLLGSAEACHENSDTLPDCGQQCRFPRVCQDQSSLIAAVGPVIHDVHI